MEDSTEFEQITADFNGDGWQRHPSLAEVADRAYKSQQSVAALIREIAYERRRRPCDDLISALASVEGESRGLTEQELLGLCVFLFSAGEETTVSLIGNSMLLLMRNPRELARLKAEPALINSAVEEFLRYESPIQILTRVVADEIEIRNRRMEPGQLVILVLGAANRDPSQFPDPDRLDIARTNNRHLAFGWAIHFCLGAPLARIEAQIAISRLLNRYPGIRLQNKPLQWNENLTLRCLESLPMTL